MTQKGRTQRRIAETLKNTEQKREVFIAALREGGVIKHAAQAAGISRTTAYRWRRKWREFESEWDEALADALDDLELTARERALDKSDQLLMFLLKAHRPATYDRKSQQEWLLQAEAGDAKVTIARIAPGLIDELLSDSELLQDDDEEDE